jgi:DNA invertase Pin-like site-specific DNA recombinase
MSTNEKSKATKTVEHGKKSADEVNGTSSIDFQGKLTSEEKRIKRLCIARESNENNHLLMEAMILQTLANMPKEPAILRARQLGISPLLEPESLMESLNLRILRVGKAKAVLMEIDGDYFLYSMSSAAKTTESGENDWTTLCANVIEEFRPIEIYVASISRLVRSFEHSGKIQSVISKHVDTVFAGNTKLAMRGGDAVSGQLMFAVFTMMAASERNAIVQRLTAGKIAKYNRGEWIGGKGVVPLGYKLDQKTLNLVLDPESYPALKATFELMADPDLSGWQVGQKIGRLGVSTKYTKDNFGDDANVSDYIYSNSFVRNIGIWIPLYLSGEYTSKCPNPFPGVEHIAGMPIHRNIDDFDGPGELHFHYKWGRPDIDPALIFAAVAGREARQTAPKTGGAARAQIAPLSGVRWVAKGFENWIVTSSRTKYFLRSRNLIEDAK